MVKCNFINGFDTKCIKMHTYIDFVKKGVYTYTNWKMIYKMSE